MLVSSTVVSGGRGHGRGGERGRGRGSGRQPNVNRDKLYCTHCVKNTPKKLVGNLWVDLVIVVML